MTITEKYALEIQNIKQLIANIKNGHVYEADPVPGTPRCSTIGAQLDEKFDLLIKKMASDAPGDLEVAANILENP